MIDRHRQVRTIISNLRFGHDRAGALFSMAGGASTTGGNRNFGSTLHEIMITDEC
jgi:hypothetical protein